MKPSAQCHTHNNKINLLLIFYSSYSPIAVSHTLVSYGAVHAKFSRRFFFRDSSSIVWMAGIWWECFMNMFSVSQARKFLRHSFLFKQFSFVCHSSGFWQEWPLWWSLIYAHFFLLSPVFLCSHFSHTFGPVYHPIIIIIPFFSLFSTVIHNCGVMWCPFAIVQACGLLLLTICECRQKASSA